MEWDALWAKIEMTPTKCGNFFLLLLLQGSISISTHSGDGHEELPDDGEREPSVLGRVADDKRKEDRKILCDDDARSIIDGRPCDENGGKSRRREDIKWGKCLPWLGFLVA